MLSSRTLPSSGSVRRYYDPATGQFISVDAALDQTGQAYSYAADDPVDEVDPSGLCRKDPFSTSFWTQGNCLSEPVQFALSEARLPDYVSVCAAGSPFIVLPSACLTITRHGHVFGTLQDNVGIPGISGQLRAGWIDASSQPAPTACQIDSFIAGPSASAGAFVPSWPLPFVLGIGPAVAETWGQEGRGGLKSFATEVGIGVGTPSGDAGQSRSWHLFNLP